MQRTPQNLGQYYGYNKVSFNQLYWAIPQSLGHVKLEEVDLTQYPQILNAFTQDELEIKIFEAWINHNRPTEPVFFKKIHGHSLVGFNGRYYGIPDELGEIRLEEINIDEQPEILVSDSLSELADILIEKMCVDIDSSEPHLVLSLKEYNIVCYQKKFIAIPKYLGDVRLENKDPETLKGVFSSKSIAELKATVIATERKGFNEFIHRIAKRIGFADS